MDWSQTEPLGTKECSSCGRVRETLARNGELDEPVCPECLYDEFGDEFLQEWVIGAGVVAEPELIEEYIVFDYGFDIEVEFGTVTKEMPASRNPNESRSVRYKKTKSDLARIYFNRTELGSVKAPAWAKKANEFLYPD